MNYRWTLRADTDEDTVHKIAKALRIPRSLANVLISRGIKTTEEAKEFFSPSLSKLHDPYLMSNMDVVVDKILQTVKEGSMIWIHGDYDVDGTASTSLMLQFLREIGAKVDYYIPDRFDEGYGLSKKSIDTAVSRNAKLLITVDVGITSFEPFAYAKANNLESIICDHHEPGDEVPDVFAIIDPLMPGDQYPFNYLAACGVAFKIIQAISQRIGEPEKAFEYLDLVAVASAADMVPLVGENRILVHHGLNKLNSNPRPGLKGLIECTNLKLGQIATSNIVYALAPLINAAGRMGDALRAVNMMIEKDMFSAFRIAQELEQENRRRRVFDEQTFEETIPLAKELVKEGRRSLVLHKPHWHAGVIGIVASRLVDKFHLPTVLLTSIEGLAKGSARSISNFDIHSALKKCSHYMTEFGGHRHAAGLSLEERHIENFRNDFDLIARENISQEMLTPEILIDSELQLNELSPNFLKVLGKFAPYGYDNNKPIFLTKGVKSVNGIKIIGNNNIKFRALHSNFVIDAIGYGLASKVDLCSGGKTFSIVYNLETNMFNGFSSPQLYIRDIRPDE